jgi:hypothetical protein
MQTTELEPADSLFGGQLPALSSRQRSPIEMRFLPNSRASRDHAPGPSIANPAAIAVTMTESQNSLILATVTHISKIATATAEIGVHRPKSTRTPAPAARNRGASCASGTPAGVAITS